MSVEREATIQALHDRGFVILKAHRNNNSPVGWKRQGVKAGAAVKFGYTEEMRDPNLERYRKTFHAADLARHHNGFYLGHGGLCCIDLDTKHSTLEVTTDLKDRIVEAVPVFTESTKNKGWHIYFLYDRRLANVPRFASKDPDDNWIELYYHSRFVACFLSSTNNYSIDQGDLLTLPVLSEEQHALLLSVLDPFKCATARPNRTGRVKALPVDESTYKEALYYVGLLEEKQLDITGGYQTWYGLGCAFANAFGLRGYDLFQRISVFSPSYNPDEIEDLYTDWVNRDQDRVGDKITIATFFKACKDAGLQDAATLVLTRQRKEEPVETELGITRRMSADTRVLVIVEAFLRATRILWVDYFYTFQHTHWVFTMDKDVMNMIYDFVDKSDYPEPMEVRTLAFWERITKLLRNKTAVRAIEPHIGDMKEEFNINLLNGVLQINLRTGKRQLMDHSPDYYFTSVVPYEYNAKAKCERFDQFLTGQMPDIEYQRYYLAYIAGCLTKFKLEKILMFIGPPDTGKSTLIDITVRVLGAENCTGIDAGTLFSGRPDGMTNVAQMEHKLLAIDTDCGNLKDTNLFKKVASGEQIMGWVMNVSRRMVSNYARLLLSLNNSFWSTFEPAIQKRALVLPFEQIVGQKFINVHLVDEIAASELPGILNRILDEGLKYLLESKGRLSLSAKVLGVSRDFHMEKSTVYQWFRQTYLVPPNPPIDAVPGPRGLSYVDRVKQANHEVRFTTDTNEQADVEWISTKHSELLAQYRLWCEDVEYCEPKATMYFRQDLTALGVVESVYREGRATVRGCVLGRPRTQRPPRGVVKLS